MCTWLTLRGGTPYPTQATQPTLPHNPALPYNLPLPYAAPAARGVAGLYQGFTAGMLNNSVSMATGFASYEVRLREAGGQGGAGHAERLVGRKTPENKTWLPVLHRQ